MKRLLSLLLALMLLSGCSESALQNPQESTDLGIFDPEDLIFQQTQGAVAAYKLPAGNKGIAEVGSRLYLFEENKLTVRSGIALNVIATQSIPGLPEPGSGLIQLRSDGVAYFDRSSGSIVFLNGELKQTMQLQLSEELKGNAWISEDWDQVYYCTETDIRALNVKTGVSRLLKEQGAQNSYTIKGLLLGDTLLRCDVRGTDGNQTTVLISTETGQVVGEGAYLSKLKCDDSRYFLQLEQTIVPEWVFGEETGTQMNLWPAAQADDYWVLWEADCVITARYTEKATVLECYDLVSGLRTAAVELPGISGIDSLCAGSEGCVWLQCGERLYKWQPEKTPLEDEHIYTCVRQTREQPDEQGLADAKLLAQQLEQKYGIAVLINQEVEAAQPWDYSFETEFLPAAYEKALQTLDGMLANFPEGFFAKAAQRSANRKLTLVLVRGIYANEENGVFTSAEGVQYWHSDNSVYIALRLGAEFERYFYHELGHLIDTKVLSGTTVYSRWENLNPPGFRYDGSYAANANRQDEQYLQDADRWFIDMYSMSFAVEDRSRIFEYASLPGNEEYFASPNMKLKLQYVCNGIRRAFGLRKDPRVFLWEQYLYT